MIFSRISWAKSHPSLADWSDRFCPAQHLERSLTSGSFSTMLFCQWRASKAAKRTRMDFAISQLSSVPCRNASGRSTSPLIASQTTHSPIPITSLTAGSLHRFGSGRLDGMFLGVPFRKGYIGRLIEGYHDRFSWDALMVLRKTEGWRVHLLYSRWRRSSVSLSLIKLWTEFSSVYALEQPSSSCT